MAEIETLIRKRGSTKAALTGFRKFIETFGSRTELSKPEFLQLQDRLARVERSFSDFEDIQSEIEATVEENLINKQFEERYNSEDLFHTWIAKGKELLDIYTEKNLVNNDSNSVRSHSTVASESFNRDLSNSVKLPTISLPNFQGHFESWLEYRDTFESLIHNNESLSEIQKFHYLRASLEGSAASIIKSVSFTSASYQVAWDLLCERFNNNKLLIHNHVKAIFNIDSIQRESSIKIRKILDDLSKNLRALEQLEQSTNNWDTLLIFLIVSKLDSNTIKEWENYSTGLAQLPMLPDLKTFLKNRANLLETLEFKNHEKESFREHNKKPVFKQNSVRSLVSSNYSCFYCKKEHSIYSCPEFANLGIEQRSEFVRKAKLCANCLRVGHVPRQCKLGPCRKCKAWHNSLLHVDKEKMSDKNQGSSKSVDNIDTSESTTTCTSSMGSTGSSHVILSTAIVQVISKNGQVYKARVLLDSASQSCYITTKLCNILGYNKQKVDIRVSGISNKSIQIHEKCIVEIHSLYTSFSAKISCLVINEFAGTLPNVPIDISTLKIPSNIRLADPEFFKPNEVDLLIGAELFWTLICSGQISCGQNRPTIRETKLGWVLSGTLVIPNNKFKNSVCHLSTLESVNLNETLSKFWELEEATSTSKPYSKEEIFCEDNFIKTTTRSEEGRFIVTMPLKDSPECLGKSRLHAEKSFYSLERRLSKNESLRDLYIKFMREYQDLGHMSPDTGCPESSDVEYFATHHGVLRAESLTSKLRVVFNCSASTSNGLSLNNIQHTGPVLQDDLLGIILRFRCHAYVFTSDVAKMYRAVLVIPEQRQLQKIFWRENSSEELKAFVLNTVTYGQTASSFLAIRCLFELANECSDPEIAQVIKRDMYVDDLLSGASNIEHAQFICKQVSQVLHSGCFDLRKWRSNEPRVLESIKNSNVSDKNLEFAPDEVSKTLGVTWCSKSDSLIFNINLPDSSMYTKRLVLSVIAKIFDPLGILSACTILAKIIMQKLWIEKVPWDTRLSEPILSKWMKLVNELPLLNNFSIPRHVICKNSNKIEMHGFCDASQAAYGACIYFRSTSENGSVKVQLLCAKSKVAPVKTLCTIPKLELCSALLLARLADKVSKSLNFEIKTRFFWSDSTISLAWIRTSPSLLKIFIGNRVSEIQGLTIESEWRYVPTKDNPADHVSRGLYPSELIKSKSWFFGPAWLQLDDSHWPTITCNKIENLPELKSIEISSMHSSKISQFFPFQRFSTFNKMVRVMAYLLRYFAKLKNKIISFSNFLTLSELDLATKRLVKLSQSESFPEEIKCLKNNLDISHKSRLYKLSVFLDSNNILRVGGRLKHSDLPMGQKHPIVLDSKHKFTQLYFEYKHKILLHCGPLFLLSDVRCLYWPVGGRNFARITVRNCVKCSRFNPILVQPKMADLPKERTTPSSPFAISGVDYAGPFLVRDRRCRGAKLVKCWVGVFICFATKALHLELISSLSTDAFLMALRRFAARRGKPSKLFSDNGTNFVGANRELGKFLNASSSRLASSAVLEHIEWSFIPPYSPHFGGLWEAGVKSVKHHLKRVLENVHFTFEEFATTLAQIEAVLNSRPLCPLSPDPCDLTPLTPAHFLIGRPMIAVPDKDVVDVKLNRLNRFQLVQRVTQHFWQRWRTSYLAELQSRNKWQSSNGQLQIGALVFVKDDHSAPCDWRLGRVEALHKGADGIARVASVKTINGVIQRSFNKLCVLPVEIPSDFKAGGMLPQ